MQSKFDDSNDVYYLTENKKKLSQPQFFRQKHRIKYFHEFSTEEFEQIFAENYSGSNNKVKQDEKLERILSKYHIGIEWFTYSIALIDINYIYTTCKIQATSKSTLHSKYCVYIPSDINKTEAGHEIFANSQATFENCHFYNEEKINVLVRDYSTATFKHCIFDNNNISCFLMSDAKATFIDCIFMNDKYISVCSIREVEINAQNYLEDDKEENDEEFHCKSWMSPSYTPPTKIAQMEEHELIKNGTLKYLKLLSQKEILKDIDSKCGELKCSHCHEISNNKEEMLLICPCGHLICNKCKDIKRCPTCDTKVSKVQRIFYGEESAICLCNTPNTVSLPCGHMCMCYECAIKNAENNFNCPMCNEHLNCYKFMFDDNEKLEFKLKKKMLYYRE